MLAVKPHSRFLGRASLLLIALLVTWWFLLIDPLLWVVRVPANILLWCVPTGSAETPVRDVPNGAWSVRVPVPRGMLPAQMASASRPGDSTSFRGLRVQVPREILAVLTLGFPVLWALMLSVPRGRRLWLLVLAGSGIVAAVSLVQMVFCVYYNVDQALHLFPGPTEQWLLRYLEYMNMQMVPYLTPFCVALGLHRELRQQIFMLGGKST